MNLHPGRNRRDELRRKITRAIVLDTGTGEQIAMHYADAVMRCLDEERAANGTIYVPAPERRHDVLQIRAALLRGESPRRVQRTFGISRTKLFELFPGGLPVPERAGEAGQR